MRKFFELYFPALRLTDGEQSRPVPVLVLPLWLCTFSSQARKYCTCTCMYTCNIDSEIVFQNVIDLTWHCVQLQDLQEEN